MFSTPRTSKYGAPDNDMLLTSVAVEGQCPVTLRGTRFWDLPSSSRIAFSESTTIPHNTRFSSIDCKMTIMQFLALQLPVIDENMIYTFSQSPPTKPPSVSFIPALPEPKGDDELDIDMLLRTEWSQGSISIQIGGGYYPLWSLKYWNDRSDAIRAAELWRAALSFIKEQLSVDSQKAAPFSSRQVEMGIDAMTRIGCLGWNAPVFTRSHHFAQTTLSMAELLDPKRWASSNHMHCGLINLRERYPLMRDSIALVDATFHDSVVSDLNQDSASNISPDLLEAAAWLREDPAHKLAALVFNNNHWAALLIESDGKITVADSKSVYTFPSWWTRAERSWKRFFELVDNQIKMKVELGNFGRQTDTYNCGPATLTAIRKFMDQSRPLFSQQYANMTRIELVYEVLTVSERRSEGYLEEEDVMLRAPRSSSPSVSQKDVVYIDIDTEEYPPGADVDMSSVYSPAPTDSNSDIETPPTGYPSDDSDEEERSTAPTHGSRLPCDSIDFDGLCDSGISIGDHCNRSMNSGDEKGKQLTLDAMFGHCDKRPVRRIIKRKSALTAFDSERSDSEPSPTTPQARQAETPSSGGRSRKKVKTERQDIFQLALDRHEIESFSAYNFLCTCSNKGPHSFGKRPYDQFKLLQHFQSAKHRQRFLYDGRGEILLDGKGIARLSQPNLHSFKDLKWVGAFANQRPSSSQAAQACLGLTDTKYMPLFSSKWDLGGIRQGSVTWDAEAKRLFPYKFDSKVRKPQGKECTYKRAYPSWTKEETLRFNRELKLKATWILHRESSSITAGECTGKSEQGSTSQACTACKALDENERFTEALKARTKAINKQLKQTDDERNEANGRALKYTRKDHLTPGMQIAKSYLDKPEVMAIYQSLSDTLRPSSSVFRKLERLADEGEFEDDKTLLDILKLLYDHRTRRRDPTGNAMKGIRYTEDALNFFVILRSRGISATGPYAAFRGVVGAASERTTRRIIASRQTGFNLIGQIDKARVKEFVSDIEKLGYGDVPIVIMVDATTLPSSQKRPTIGYTTMFAKEDIKGHVVGSTLSMEESAVRDDEDLVRISDRIEDEKLEATDLLTVMIGISIDGVPPKAIALYPSANSNTGERLHSIIEEARKAVVEQGGVVVAIATDGGSSERNAQALFVSERSDEDAVHPRADDHHTAASFLDVTVEAYGITLSTPVIDGHPIVMVQDPEHARKTLRNNLSAGTRLLCLGRSLVAYELLLRMLGYDGTGLTKSDLMWVDKQDDGAALRLFHSTALSSLLVDGKIRPQMQGLFVVLFIFGELFDAWLNRTLPHTIRLLSAWRAYFFLTAWKQDMSRLRTAHPLFVGPGSSLSAPAWVILEQVAVSLILLIEVYAKHHPSTPLQPWNLSTRSLEHWFGEARRLFGVDFTVSELLFGVRTQDLRSRIFHDGDRKLQGQRERKSKVGYQFCDTPLRPDSAIWRQLSEYPTVEQRTSSIPISAFAQACTFLDTLGMPHPDTPSSPSSSLSTPTTATANGSMIPRPTVRLTMGIINCIDEEGDVADETDSSDSDIESKNPFKKTAPVTTSPDAKRKAIRLQNAVRIASSEAASRSLLATKLDYFENDAAGMLQELENNDANDFGPSLSYLLHEYQFSHQDLEPKKALVDLPAGSMNPIKVVELREQHDPPTRLNSERSKATAASLPQQEGEGKYLKPSEISRYLRERRDVASRNQERGTRTRTKNSRQIRWERKRQLIAKAYTSSRDHYTVHEPVGRNVSSKNSLQPGSLVLCRHPGRSKIPPRFYLAKVIGVFFKSGAKYSCHSRAESLDSTVELSAMDLWIYEPMTDTGDLFSHGRNRLYQTHAGEDQLLHHFGPFDTYIEQVSAGSNVFYSFIGSARCVWEVLTTDTVNAAIVTADYQGRPGRKKGNQSKAAPVVEDEEENEEDEEHEEEHE